MIAIQNGAGTTVLAPLGERRTMSDGPARTVLIGGGFAGLELARHLAAGGLDDILVLEAGPVGDPRHINIVHDPATAAALWLDPRDDPHYRRPWASTRLPHFGGNAGLRSRLGGRSLYWFGVTLPIEDWALAGWPADVATDLVTSWRGGPALYELTARELGLTWSGGTVSVGPERPLGHLRLRPVPRAVRAHPQVAGRWSAYSPLDHWRDPSGGGVVTPPSGVRIRTGTTVSHLTHDGGRVTGVVADGRPVAAHTVVLCAGTVENSRLAVQALAEPGRPVPMLGGLSDHLAQGFFIRLDAATLPRPLPLRPGSYYVPFPGARSNLFLSLWRESRTELVIDVKINGELSPDPDSYVTCRPGADLPWAVRVCPSISAAGRAVVETQRAVLDEVWAAVAAAFGLAGTLTFGDFDDPPNSNTAVLHRHRYPMGRPQTWASPLGAEDHEGGTLPIGRVLTTGHEFPGIGGLYAAGPATFPRLGAANPSLTTMALARRLAATLIDTAGKPRPAAPSPVRGLW
jgi:choline dehydrogenase-like flavoprotein